MLSLSFSQGMHLTVPPSTLPLLDGLSSQQDVPPKKGLGRSRKIGLFPSPHHQTIPPFSLTFDPWPHHIPYWLGTGWWCLGLACAFLSYMSKNLPAANAFAAIWSFVCTVYLTSSFFYVGRSLFPHSTHELGFIWWWVLHFFGPLLGFLYFL